MNNKNQQSPVSCITQYIWFRYIYLALALYNMLNYILAALHTGEMLKL